MHSEWQHRDEAKEQSPHTVCGHWYEMLNWAPTICLRIWSHWIRTPPYNILGKDIFVSSKFNFNSMSNDTVQGPPLPMFPDDTAVESNSSPSFTDDQFILSDAVLGNTASNTNTTVTCDQLSGERFSLHWIDDWHWLEQNGSVTSSWELNQMDDGTKLQSIWVDTISWLKHKHITNTICTCIHC
jgi:hypothetical protein